jgi:hypothetical protein
MKDIKLKICIGCYATYNDGYLFDKWFTVEDTIDLERVWKEAEAHHLESIKKARPDWIAEGYLHDSYCEELYIACEEAYIDGEFIKTDFSECYGEAEKFLEAVNADYSHPFELLMEVAKNRGQDLSDLTEIDKNLYSIQVDSKSDSDLSHAIIEMNGGIEMLSKEELQHNFDHDSHGSDLYHDFTHFEVNGQDYAVSSN